jgi:hypothetical protein
MDPKMTPLQKLKSTRPPSKGIAALDPKARKELEEIRRAYEAKELPGWSRHQLAKFVAKELKLTLSTATAFLARVYDHENPA